MIISSLTNQRVKDVVRLRNRRSRDRAEKLLIEGYRELLRAVDNGYPIEELFFCPELFQGENEEALISRLQGRGAQVVQTTDAVFRKMAYRDRPEGLIGIGPQVRRSLDDLDLSSASPLFLAAEAIEKPGNLGTILRSADGAGATGLILCDRCTDLFNPNVVRASIGTIFCVPVADASSEEALAWLHEHQIRILAATPHSDRLYTEVDFTGPVAISVGTEQYGLSEGWMQSADLRVRIPMLGQVDSLNVATATALLLYEAVRQRHGSGMLAPGARP